MNKYQYKKGQKVITSVGNYVIINDRYKCFDGTILYQLKYSDGHLGKQWIFEDMISLYNN